jgi:hypothetical protein
VAEVLPAEWAVEAAAGRGNLSDNIYIYIYIICWREKGGGMGIRRERGGGDRV